MISFSELLKRPIQIYSTHFNIFLKLLLIPLVLNIAISIITVTSNIALTMALVLPLTLLSMIVTAWTELMLVRAFYNYYTKNAVDISATLRESLQKLPSFIFLLILWVALIALGLAFLIIPGILFAIWFMFLSSVLVIEDQRGLAVFRRSKQLATTNFFGLLWRAALAVLIIFGTLILAAQGFVAIFQTVFGRMLSQIIFNMVANGFTTGLSLFFLPAFIGVIVTLYLDLSKRS